MITDPPVLTVRRNFERPSPELVEAFRGIPTGYLVDAMSGRNCLGYNIRPLTAEKASLLGVAVTCHAGPADNLALFGALDVLCPGDVLIAATDAFMKTSVTGDLLLGMARNLGASGFVTDGLVRDLDGIEKVGLPVYCAGLTANSPVRNGPGTVGLPVVISDVVVHPGDIITGDRDGVVVVPRLQAKDVLAALDGIKAAERALEEKVNAGLGVPDFIRAILDSDCTRYLD